MAWEWAVVLGSKALDAIGIGSRQKRMSRGAVLGALTRFHGLVNEVCAGDSAALSPNVRTAFFSKVDAAYQEAARKLNEESQWVGKIWLRDVERLMALGRSAVIRYDSAYGHEGPLSAQEMKEARQACQKFKGLFEKIRG